MSYLCNVDTGGTHTDAVIIDESGGISKAKAPSTPEDFSRGFFDALEVAAEERDLSLEDLLDDTDLVSHGTTVGTNALIEEEGTDAALVTTHGMEDILFIMRGAAGRSKGLPIEEVLSYQQSSKPEPIIPKSRVAGVDGRIDCMGDEIVAFNEERAREVARELNEQGVDSVGISFLWSFLNESHETEMATILDEELDEDVFVTESNELIPKWGEYERTAAVGINAYIGPTTSGYIERIDQNLAEKGYDGTLLVMQAGGGVVPANDAVKEPIRTIDSGPVGGVVGCQFLADQLGHSDVLATDMGGTSFDVGLLVDGQPLTKPTNVIRQYEYLIRNIDIESVGSGGGSIAWVDESTNRLQVGPKSAGAKPGPACYNRGGTDATVTDADLLLGFLDEEFFLGGRESLDVGRAREEVEQLADVLGMGVTETASAIVEIVNAKMADLIEQRTINKGYDPRKFTLYAYGGAGPLHMPSVGRQLDVDTIVVPNGDLASVWSAVGISSSDVLHRNEITNIMRDPFDPDEVTDLFEEVESEVRDQLADEEFEPEDIEIQRYADLRYREQVHELSVSVPGGQLSSDDMEDMLARFEQRYEERYGKGSGYSEAGFELATIRVDAYGDIPSPQLRSESSGTGNVDPATEQITWPSRGETMDTPVYYTQDIHPETLIDGPAVLRMDHTTVAVPPNDTCEIDEMGNFIITIGGN